jgi:hypothetical protein
MDGFYLDGTTGVNKCNKTCATCSDGSSCDTCRTGFAKGKDLRGANTGFCTQANCGPGFYSNYIGDSQSSICSKCAGTTLSGGGAFVSATCKQCADGDPTSCLVTMDGWYVGTPTSTSVAFVSGTYGTPTACPTGC